MKRDYESDLLHYRLLTDDEWAVVDVETVKGLVVCPTCDGDIKAPYCTSCCDDLVVVRLDTEYCFIGQV